VDCRQTWGEDRVYFHDDLGQLARLPLQWTDVVPDDPTVVVGAGQAHFRYDDLCRLADLLAGVDAASAREQGVRGHDGPQLLEHASAQYAGLRGQANPLIVGEPEPPRSQLLAENAILFLQIVEDVALLLVDPACGSRLANSRADCQIG
jgi:hypothetical protein